jgi:hypothetical protein
MANENEHNRSQLPTKTISTANVLEGEQNQAQPRTETMELAETASSLPEDKIIVHPDYEYYTKSTWIRYLLVLIALNAIFIGYFTVLLVEAWQMPVLDVVLFPGLDFFNWIPISIASTLSFFCLYTLMLERLSNLYQNKSVGRVKLRHLFR